MKAHGLLFEGLSKAPRGGDSCRLASWTLRRT